MSQPSSPMTLDCSIAIAAVSSPARTLDALAALDQLRQQATARQEPQRARLCALLMDLCDVAALLSEQNPNDTEADRCLDYCRTALTDMQTGGNSSAAHWASVTRQGQDEFALSLDLLPQQRGSDQSAAGDDLWGFDADPWSADSSMALQMDEEELPASAVDVAELLRTLGAAAPSSATPSPARPTEALAARSQHVGSNRSATFPESPMPHEVDLDGELRAAFIDDAEQCLGRMQQTLADPAATQNAATTMRAFCRELHTLKGASGTIGLSELSHYLHACEDAVEVMAGQDINDLTPLHTCMRVVEQHLQHLNGEVETPFPVQPNPPATTTASAAAVTATPLLEGSSSIRIETSRVERLMDLLGELVMLRNRRESELQQLKLLPLELSQCAQRVSLLPLQHAGSVTTDTAHHRGLTEIAADLTELARSVHEQIEQIERDALTISHSIGAFRQELTDLRRRPVVGLFRRLEQAITDAARMEGKLVEFDIDGQGTRVERLLQDRLYEPLLHLVRNAVSHGIETPEQRQLQGKRGTGRIALTASVRDNVLSIDVRDDGRGIDEPSLRRRGEELGLLPRGGQVSAEQVRNLIFHPGLSTRKEVNEVAGRGVGMDVVAARIQEMRGRLDVESAWQQGTTFRLQVPLTSPIEHAMMVRAAGQLFALPLQAIAGTSDSTEATTTATLRPREDDPLSQSPPLQALSTLLDLRGESGGIGQTLTICDPVLLAKSSSSGAVVPQLRLQVDSVVGVEEVVPRPLPPLLRKHPLFAGITLSGNAETVLMLDVARLMKVSSTTSDRLPSANVQDEASARGRHLLTADDSMTVRRDLGRKLRAQGFQVTDAENGRRALELMQDRAFDGLVTDLDMPVMSGWELITELRGDRRWKDLPIVVVTGRSDPKTLQRLAKLGVQRTINKPFTNEHIDQIQAALAESAYDATLDR
ncbi:MAG: response regulator [Planctomycetaceae bacterium]|nr:response regulator [Planctomycetaceae bacterium]